MRLLIIEDDPDIVELVQYNLEREGFRVAAARDGERGLQEASSTHPSLILLDLMLPGMEGLDPANGALYVNSSGSAGFYSRARGFVPVEFSF